MTECPQLVMRPSTGCSCIDYSIIKHKNIERRIAMALFDSR